MRAWKRDALNTIVDEVTRILDGIACGDEAEHSTAGSYESFSLVALRAGKKDVHAGVH